ncbi:hypothetical protein PHMEG_0005367 [Phytophthora megakarya]|uniref:PiggyBac transposable element-derived protein domain-containing protein n=1 Tax=Phytophthora megakarya TaxID=4795 RepID=A0A225WT44_9STRA|nr:hypothetical protein PHMEG_0005367 [Phytophthora megakarya]
MECVTVLQTVVGWNTGGADGAAFSIASSVIDPDPNLMVDGANECARLNSDDDPDIEEEPEEEKYADGDAHDVPWSGDWQLRELSNEESGKEIVGIPAPIWSSVAKDTKKSLAMRQTGRGYDTSKFGLDPTHADIYRDVSGLNAGIINIANDPLALLFYYLPPSVWSQIAVESNRYQIQSIPARARAHCDQQRKRSGEIENLSDIRRHLANFRKGITAHWSMKTVEALPTNRFGLFMNTHRFFHVMGNLHLANTKTSHAKSNRAGKIRPVVNVLQRTFARGYPAPAIISFDEAALPSRSRYNPMRQFNKVTPRHWVPWISSRHARRQHISCDERGC